MNMIKEKIKNWVKTLIKDAVKEAIKSENIGEKVGIAIEKLRYDYLPHGACWMCSMPVSRKGGYSLWRGKMFCQELCIQKYAGLIQSSNENYRILNGDPIEKFKGEELDKHEHKI